MLRPCIDYEYFLVLQNYSNPLWSLPNYRFPTRKKRIKITIKANNALKKGWASRVKTYRSIFTEICLQEPVRPWRPPMPARGTPWTSSVPRGRSSRWWGPTTGGFRSVSVTSTGSPTGASTAWHRGASGSCRTGETPATRTVCWSPSSTPCCCWWVGCQGLARVTWYMSRLGGRDCQIPWGFL